jgi:CRISPR-associated endonuclease/helicase Cas3
LNTNDYIAHITENGKEQTIKEHSINVAELCEKFSIYELKPIAYITGILHDIGKYSELFQQRIRGKDISVEHSSSGAIEALNILGKNNMISYIVAYCIAGHHTGLPDGGNKTDLEEEGTLSGKLKRKKEDYSYYKNEIIVPKLNVNSTKEYLVKGIMNPNDVEELLEKYAFITKYLFSCLTDADFLDTEKFYNDINREIKSDFKRCLELINKAIGEKQSKTKVQAARKLLQFQAFSKTEKDAEIYLLNMPTGSGKTLCSMKYALERVIRKNKKRIIYVIPYTSIIEQTADVFENIFGQHIQILQHHSNYFYDENSNNSEEHLYSEKMRKATENWDAPIIITTNVQFFQSIYDYRSSKLRKLHNIADSIIVFDEIHMMPIDYLQPCIRAIGYVAKLLNSEILLLTATMPNFKDLFKLYIPNANVTNLVEDKSIFPVFKNCTYKYLGTCELESIIENSFNYESSLIIVNSRKKARKLYSMCTGKKYHLSTYMTSYDRSKVIRNIRNDLQKKNKITVVSTSLIEAGVDVDFEAVFRELSGLDSLLQSAGRCNREGKRENGYMYIFENEDISKKQSDLAIRINIARGIINRNSTAEDIDLSSTECIETYYEHLYGFNNDKIERNSIAKQCKDPRYLPFRTYAEGFKMIDSDTIAIVIERDEYSHDLIQELKYGKKNVMRKLQKYTSNIYIWEFEELLKQGVLDDYKTGIYCLTNLDYYDDEIGLVFEINKDYTI